MKQTASYLIIFILAGISLFASCGGGNTRTNTAATPDTDTLVPAKAEIRLPDTAFASVEALKYTVEVLDTTEPASLSSLDNLYADAPGIFIFRGSPHRDAPHTGTLDGQPTEIVVNWRFSTKMDSKWGGGSGWTGQPVLISWPDSLAARFKKNGTVTDDFSNKEIIVGSLAGRIYFIDYNTGKASRPDIDVTNPIKGAVSLDPTLNGNLYVGHGINNGRPFGAITINLFRHAITHQFGQDPKAPRGWGAYDSNAIRVGQFVFRAGENGAFYKWYIQSDGTPELHSVLRFTRNGAGPGIESSPAIYANYAYFGDNGGNILCVNLDTMRPVWLYDNHDDTDATPVVAIEDGKPYVYVANEVDKQGAGKAYFTKLDALTGQRVWEVAFDARSEVLQTELRTKHFDGGFYSTPLPGRGDCADLIFSTVVLNNKRQNGDAVAIDRKTGQVVWQTPLKYYAWSSPVAFTDKSGKMYLLVADTLGTVYIMDARTGAILLQKTIGANFESSPVVDGNSVVVGSRGNQIIRFSIK